MSMHNEAERLRVLAEKLDPEPPLPDFFNHRVDRKAWDEWNVRRIQRHDVSFIATPGALLGAAVDLLVHALGPEKAMKLVYAASFDGMLLADPMAMLRRLLDDADAMPAEDNDD